ncbi:MAG: flagellar motor protein MotA, partial [Planctomycetes bacterium RBG_16_59_8]
MDVLTIVGLILGLSAIVLGQIMEGGHVGSLLQLPAAIIVFGGTIGAILVNYPISVLKLTIKNLRLLFTEPRESPAGYINQIVAFSTISRKDGLLALEQKASEIHDPFFRKGLRLVVDGTDPKTIRETLEIEIAHEEEDLILSAKPLESAGGYSPTIGIIGAVLGLIHVMENLADPSKLGAGIATAFVATIYGVGGANLIFLPLAGKMKGKVRKSAVIKSLILE